MRRSKPTRPRPQLPSRLQIDEPDPPRPGAPWLLRGALERSGLKQTEAARRSGIPRPYLNSYLRGKRPLTPLALIALAAPLRVDPLRLVEVIGKWRTQTIPGIDRESLAVDLLIPEVQWGPQSREWALAVGSCLSCVIEASVVELPTAKLQALNLITGLGVIANDYFPDEPPTPTPIGSWESPFDPAGLSAANPCLAFREPLQAASPSLAHIASFAHLAVAYVSRSLASPPQLSLAASATADGVLKHLAAKAAPDRASLEWRAINWIEGMTAEAGASRRLLTRIEGLSTHEQQRLEDFLSGIEAGGRDRDPGAERG